MTAASPKNGSRGLQAFLVSNGALVEVCCPQCGQTQPAQPGKVKANSDEGPPPCGSCEFVTPVWVYVLLKGARLSFAEPKADHGDGGVGDQEVVMGCAFEHDPKKGDQADRAQSNVPLFRHEVGEVIQGFARKCFQSVCSLIGWFVAAVRRMK